MWKATITVDCYQNDIKFEIILFFLDFTFLTDENDTEFSLQIVRYSHCMFTRMGNLFYHVDDSHLIKLI